MKFLSQLLSEARGSVAGACFSRNSSGAYVRARVTPVNPNTIAQSKVRQKFSLLSNKWKALSVAQRDSWQTGRTNFPTTDSLGQVVILTAQQLYMSLNRNLQAIGSSPVLTCPTPATVDNPIITSLAFSTLSMTVDFDPIVVAVGSSMLVECSAPVSQGVNFAGRSAFRQIAVLPAGTATGEDILSAYNAKFGSGSVQVNSKIFIRLVITDIASGITSDKIQGSSIVV